jgi:hypothetical protein
MNFSCSFGLVTIYIFLRLPLFVEKITKTTIAKNAQKRSN